MDILVATNIIRRMRMRWNWRLNVGVVDENAL